MNSSAPIRVRSLFVSLLVPWLCLSGCKKAEPVKFPKNGPKIEVKADGLAYELGSDKPFTGKVLQYLPKSASVFRETNYTLGKLDGYDKRWFRDKPSQISHQQLWVAGDPVFVWRWWPNGNLKEMSAQRNGLKEHGRIDIAFGSYVKWFEDGRLQFKAYYDLDFLWHGHVIDFNDAGKMMWDAEFNHGHYVSGYQAPAEPVPDKK